MAHHPPHVLHDLVVDQLSFARTLQERGAHVGEVVLLRRIDNVLCALLAIPVHDHVVGDAHQPGTKLAVGDVLALLQTGDYLEEGLLEHIVRHLAVADDKQYIGKQLLLIAAKQKIESLVVTIYIHNGQLFVGHQVQILHDPILFVMK